MRLIAVACLLLASKYDELDEKIPFVNELAEICSEIVKIKKKTMLNLEA